jgi:hypothetical protein
VVVPIDWTCEKSHIVLAQDLLVLLVVHSIILALATGDGGWSRDAVLVVPGLGCGWMWSPRRVRMSCVS